MTSALPKLPNLDAVWLAIPLAVLLYALLLYDARRTGSPAAGDDQLGIKTLGATLAVVGAWVLTDGLRGFLVTILTFDDFWDKLKATLPSLLVGVAVVLGAGIVLLSRTNAAHYPKAKRLAAGVVALGSGVALVPALVTLLGALLDWPSWRAVALALANVIAFGVVFVVALSVLGRLSGARLPERMASGGSPRPGQGGLGQPFGGVVQAVPPGHVVASPSAPIYVGAPAPAPAPSYVAPQTQVPAPAPSYVAPQTQVPAPAPGFVAPTPPPGAGGHTPPPG